MKIERKTFARLLAFVDKFPPIILWVPTLIFPLWEGPSFPRPFSGGCYELPMAKALNEKAISFDGYPQVEASIVKWPLSVIRLSSVDQDVLVDLADKILFHWRAYSDPKVEVQAFTGEYPPQHHHPHRPQAGRPF